MKKILVFIILANLVGLVYGAMLYRSANAFAKKEAEVKRARLITNEEWSTIVKQSDGMDFLKKHVERLTEDTHALRDALNDVSAKSSGVAVILTGLTFLNLISVAFALRSAR